MKTKQSLKSSADARLKEAIKTTERVQKHLKALQEGESLEKHMPTLRVIAPYLTGLVYEFNAYRNSLETE
jgi:hypothetical protein